MVHYCWVFTFWANESLVLAVVQVKVGIQRKPECDVSAEALR